MDGVIKIKKAQIKSGYLEIDFNDGVNSKIDINKLQMEFYNKDPIIKSIPKPFTVFSNNSCFSFSKNPPVSN